MDLLEVGIVIYAQISLKINGFMVMIMSTKFSLLINDSNLLYALLYCNSSLI